MEEDAYAFSSSSILRPSRLASPSPASHALSTLLDLLRYTVFAAFAASAVIAVGSWAVRTRRISPFSGAARLIRSLTDPIINPMERWVHRRGGNPQHAPGWLLGIVVVGGILLITVAQWPVA